jgi:hypothetical protein
MPATTPARNRHEPAMGAVATERAPRAAELATTSANASSPNNSMADA